MPNIRNDNRSISRRPTVAEENVSLKDTIKALQDQNTSLAADNHELDKQNSVLEERLSNFGLRDLCKDLGLIGIGTAIGNYFNKEYEQAALIAVLSSLLIIGFSVYDNFWSKRLDKKEKVGT